VEVGTVEAVESAAAADKVGSYLRGMWEISRGCEVAFRRGERSRCGSH
jgi:hypothetical protein